MSTDIGFPCVVGENVASVPSSMHAHDAVGLHSAKERVGEVEARRPSVWAMLGERGDCG